MLSKINIMLESSETKNSNDTIAVIEENIIKYNETSNTTVTLNTKDNILIRENDELLMEFKFDINEITENNVFIKKLNQTLIVMIKTMNIICKNNYYKVEYEIIDNDKFNYIIKIGEKYEQN